MEKTPKILELFPTPIFLDFLPLGFEHLIDFFDFQEMIGLSPEIPQDQIDSFNFGARSKNTYILDSEECRDFKNYILSLSLKFGQTLGYPYTEYKLSQSWLSWKSPGQQHIKHTHSNSIISGVFYYGHFEDNTPSIEFHKTDPIHGLIINLKSPIPNQHNPFTQSNYQLTTSPGMITLFPSSLVHSVPLNTTKEIRKSLAFNVVPKEGFGEEKSLNRLKFN
jgi:uncharacterized protein (TIGR02466 family)